MDDDTDIYETRRSSKLKNYARLEEVAWGGNFHKIYKAKIRKTGEIVAMKTVNIGDDGYSHAVREITMMKMLDHPNIVRIIDIVDEELRLHLIYEWMEMDLKKYLDTLPEGQKMDPELIRSYMFQITTALVYCHSRRIIHRDLKPRNLLINREGLLKLTNFCYHREHSMWYSPPEIIFSTRHYTNSLDIWSMGCTFAEMVTRKVLFEGYSEVHQMKIMREIMTTSTEEMWPGISQLNEGRVLKTPFRELREKQLRRKVKGITQNGYELLNLMLRWDPEHRIPAKKMLQHKYFDDFDTEKLIRPFGDDDGVKNMEGEQGKEQNGEEIGEGK